MSISLAVAAMLAEVALGYPDWLYRAVGHPVTWIGALIGGLERRFNRGSRGARRAAGCGVAVVLVLVSGGVGWGLSAGLGTGLGAGGVGMIALAVLGSALIAQRSLGAHVRDVARALESGGLEAGRIAVARIVGRDPLSLDEAGVARAAVESLAENFSDGVVAPVVWMAVGGLPGAAIYKAVNTADSMIGHRTERHAAFGWAAARLDDVINLPASRLTAGLLIGAAALVPGASARGAARAVWRDAGGHRSPNAGWPEAAMAGALGFALAGPRVYGGVLVADVEMGRGGRRDLGAADIRRALRLYWVADGLLIAGLLLGVILTV